MKAHISAPTKAGPQDRQATDGEKKARLAEPADAAPTASAASTNPLTRHQLLASSSPQARQLHRFRDLANNTRLAMPLREGQTTAYKLNQAHETNKHGFDANRPLQRLKANAAASSTAQPVIQCTFTFRVQTENYTIENTRYTRTFGRYMTGNSEYKHVTADSVKDELWKGMEGMGLDAFVTRLLEIVDLYSSLPGVDLALAHVLSNDDPDSDEQGADPNGQINGPMRTNFEEFKNVQTDLNYHASNLSEWKDKFLQAPTDNKQAKDAAAFHIQNLALELIENLDKFRDLMPLVNVISGIQKRGSEKEAKAFLNTGVANAKISSGNAALWAFFDFAAIDQLAADDDLQDSIPWLDSGKLKIAVAGNTNKNINAVTLDDMRNALAGIMLANHIKLTTLSYPTAAGNANFGTQADVLAQLNLHSSPIDRATVSNYATGTWDWFKGQQ